MTERAAERDSDGATEGLKGLLKGIAMGQLKE